MTQTELIEALGGFDTPVLADAMREEGFRGGLGGRFHALIPGKRVAGVAVTLNIIAAPEGEKPDIAALPAAVEEARGREAPILVIRTEVPGAVWGGCIGANAQSAGVRAVVIDGTIRDTAELIELGDQIFFREKNPESSKWEALATGLMEPVTVGGVTIRAGDFVVGDDDGVVVVPPDRSEAVLTRARTIAGREEITMDLLLKGHTFAEAMKLREAKLPGKSDPRDDAQRRPPEQGAKT